MSIMQKIQADLKAPKGQTNSFGNYKYRSCEDIVEAVKPLLAEHGAHLNISDEIILVGDRVYVKATARVKIDKEVLEEASASAREPVSKKGMDDAQLTGATSSYARKYALNGLFAIDDTKDADTQDNRAIGDKKVEAITADQKTVLLDTIKEAGMTEAQFLEWGKIDSIDGMPANKYHKALGALEKKIYDNKG